MHTWSLKNWNLEIGLINGIQHIAYHRNSVFNMNQKQTRRQTSNNIQVKFVYENTLQNKAVIE